MNSEKEGPRRLAEQIKVNPKTIEAIRRRIQRVEPIPPSLKGGKFLVPHLSNGTVSTTGEIISSEQLEEITRILEEKS